MNIYKKVKYKKYQLFDFVPAIEKDIEIWRDIKSYEGKYKVSNLGNIWSVHNDRNFEQNYKEAGYYRVKFHDINQKAKMFFIHIIVAKHFVEDTDPSNGIRIVDHINDKRYNNRADNLRWITFSGNSQSYHDNFSKKREIIQYNLKWTNNKVP